MKKICETICYYIFFIIWTVSWCSGIIILIHLIPHKYRHFLAIALYGIVVSWLLRFFCKITWQVEGLANIPSTPCVIVANHQSSWETFYLQWLFTPQATVVKKELFNIPFFGWALKTLECIPIDRKNPRQALKAIHNRGLQALKNSRWVLIFPEGTRNLSNIGKYSQSASILAIKAGVPILPIVHNSGCCCPCNKLWKNSGEIKIRIGTQVDTTNKTSKEITEQLEQWSREQLSNLVSKH